MTAHVYYKCAACEKLLFVTERVQIIEDKAPTVYPQKRRATDADKYPEGHGYFICFPKHCPDCTNGHPEVFR